MSEWLREPTMEDAQYYRDVIEAICGYYGEKHSSKLIKWINEFIPDFPKEARDA